MLLVPAERSHWMAQLEDARDNIRAALTWSVSAGGELAVGVALSAALGWYWLMSGRSGEADPGTARSWRGGERPTTVSSWAKVLHGSALQLWAHGDLAEAAAQEESAVGIFRSAGEGRWLAYGLALLAQLRTGQGRPAEARGLLAETLAGVA